MNRAERRFLILAFFLFGLGHLARLGALDQVTALHPVEQPLSPDSLAAAEIPGDSVKPAQASKVSGASRVSSRKKVRTTPLSINKATIAELCTIKGIGPALAARIVEYRGRKGPFRSSRDLNKVPGIGQKKLKAICEWVIFD